MTKRICTPQDRLFKSLLAHTEVARDFVAVCLPDTLKAQLDIDQLSPEPTTFVDDALDECVCDCLFSVPIANQPSYLYVLFEAQSTPQRDMPIRLMKYLTTIMEWHLKNHPGTKVPIIYPVIFYSGERRYRYSTRFLDLFNVSEQMQHTITEAFRLIEIGCISDTIMTKHPWLGATVGSLDPAVRRDFEVIKHYAACFRTIAAAEHHTIMDEILSCWMETTQFDSTAVLTQTLKRILSDQWGEQHMNLLEKVQHEAATTAAKEALEGGLALGKAEGKAKGMALGRAATELYLLSRC